MAAPRRRLSRAPMPRGRPDEGSVVAPRVGGHERVAGRACARQWRSIRERSGVSRA